MGAGRLFVPSVEPGVGDRVLVEVIFQAGRACSCMARSRWRRTTGDAARARWRRGRARGERELGDQLPARLRTRRPARRARASPAPHPPRGRVHGAARKRPNFTRDLTRRAPCVRTAEQLPVASIVPLLIYPPGGDFDRSRFGEVARQSDGNDRGVGMIFVSRTRPCASAGIASSRSSRRLPRRQARRRSLLSPVVLGRVRSQRPASATMPRPGSSRIPRRAASDPGSGPST